MDFRLGHGLAIPFLHPGSRVSNPILIASRLHKQEDPQAQRFSRALWISAWWVLYYRLKSVCSQPGRLSLSIPSTPFWLRTHAHVKCQNPSPSAVPSSRSHFAHWVYGNYMSSLRDTRVWSYINTKNSNGLPSLLCATETLSACAPMLRNLQLALSRSIWFDGKTLF